MKIFRTDWKYSILYRLKRGMSISMSLTFRCNLICPYCTMRLNGIGPREAKETGLDEWKLIIDTFPGRLKEVFITGGEPTLMPYCTDLINYITAKKILVTLFTNLTKPEHIRFIKPTSYFRIEASLHPQVKIADFNYNLYSLRKCGYHIIIDEVGSSRMKGSNVKHQITSIQELIHDRARLRFAPDLRMNLTCYDLYFKP